LYYPISRGLQEVEKVVEKIIEKVIEVPKLIIAEKII
jgi:hypothetical protein